MTELDKGQKENQRTKNTYGLGMEIMGAPRPTKLAEELSEIQV